MQNLLTDDGEESASLDTDFVSNRHECLAIVLQKDGHVCGISLFRKDGHVEFFVDKMPECCSQQSSHYYWDSPREIIFNYLGSTSSNFKDALLC